MSRPIRASRSLQLCVAGGPRPPLDALGDFGDPGFVDAWLETVEAHRLSVPAIGAVLSAKGSAPLDPAAHRRLTATRDARRRRRALFEMEIDRIGVTLADAVDRPLFLKGAALARTVYAQPLDRDVRDIDVLVDPDEVDAAITALAPLGYLCRLTDEAIAAYRREHFHLQLQRDNGIVVEVHWDLSRPRDPWRLDARAVRRRATSPASPSCHTPAPEDSVQIAVLQCLQEGFSRLDRLVDVDRLLRAGLDVETLAAAAGRQGLGPAVDWTLRLATRLLGAPGPPEESLAMLAPRRAALLERLDPERLVLDRQACGRPTMTALIAWLLSASGDQRRAVLARIGAHDALARWWNLERGAPPPATGPLARAVGWSKLAVFRAGLIWRRPG